ncbi:MAG: UTP--glucose-1-phosphate uridylyltransferase [Candidatus Saccharimonadales bacterium]|jgi:UTP--glucose-1-phosphate uridylyltransferase
MKVKKAVIAAAGFGTRFLPQTKAMPKEMLPLVDKPIIQHIVEELVNAGIEDIIIVSNYSKRAIEDHFDVPNAELSAALVSSGKEKLLEELRHIADMANFVYVRQKEPLGNAAPLVYAGHLIKDEPFIYTWGDDFIDASPSRFQQMINAYEKTGGSIVSCVRIHEDADYDRYGVVAGEQDGGNMFKMTTIVEKPGKANAPSDLASVSGYLFAPEIMKYVDKIYADYDRKDELKIQNAMQMMIDAGHPYFAYEVANGHYYDAGNKLEYLKTMIDFALQNDEISDDFREYLKSKV